MVMTSGRQALLDILVDEGVTTLFGNPGTTELAFMDMLSVNKDVKYYLGLQEAPVMSMADGFAQASGKVAFANFHVMPGLGNAMGMLYNAKCANAPLLVTAGQQDRSYAVTEPILYGNLSEMARPLVKFAADINRPQDLPTLVRRAIKVALTPPMGPVFLSLPGDMLLEEADLDLGRSTRILSNFAADREAIDRAARKLAAARSPVIMAGDAIAQSAAFPEIVRIAELLGAPVYAESVASRANFPASHPLYRGDVPRIAGPVAAALAGHDTLFSIGADLFTFSLPSPIHPIPDGMDIVHLDTDSWQIGKSYAAEGVFGDPKATLPLLADAIEALWDEPTRRAAQQRRIAMEAETATQREALRSKAKSLVDTPLMSALTVVEAIGSFLPPEAVIVEEAISSAQGIRQFTKCDDPQSFYGIRGGGIGWGISAAVGIQIALPDRPVVALIGDGSALYTCQILWTAAHYNLPVTFVILNNQSYRILKQRTQALKSHAADTGTYVAMDLNDPPVDFVGLAKSFGVKGERIERLDGLIDALHRAMTSGGPTLLDVMIDPAFG